jgi:hypothetical protein
MGPAAVAFLGAGLMMSGVSRLKERYAQADAEEANASFYREQAKFAKESGDRQLMLFDRQSKVLYGEQRSAFAKAGVDVTESSSYLAKEMFYGSQENQAIMDERDMNVRLASLRADAAQKNASQMRSGGPMAFAGDMLAGASRAFGGD